MANVFAGTKQSLPWLTAMMLGLSALVRDYGLLVLAVLVPGLVGFRIALRGEALPPRPAFAELIPYPSWDHEGRSITSADGKWKLFDRVSDHKVELYDLTADPAEKQDVYTAHPDVAKQLEAQLLDFVEVTLQGGE